KRSSLAVRSSASFSPARNGPRSMTGMVSVAIAAPLTLCVPDRHDTAGGPPLEQMSGNLHETMFRWRWGRPRGRGGMGDHLAPAVSLDFLDGYLFRLLQEIAAQEGLEKSGLLNYYGSRIANRIGGLIEYEEGLARYLLNEYPGYRVVHAGMGVGTL